MSMLFPARLIRGCPFCTADTVHRGNNQHTCSSCCRSFSVAKARKVHVGQMVKVIVKEVPEAPKTTKTRDHLLAGMIAGGLGIIIGILVTAIIMPFL